MDEHCDSCGRDDGPVAPVHRVFVTPEAWDTPEKIEVVADLERWCAVCVEHYPHRPVDTGS